jgi:hypothetical protein
VQCNVAQQVWRAQRLSRRSVSIHGQLRALVTEGSEALQLGRTIKPTGVVMRQLLLRKKETLSGPS